LYNHKVYKYSQTRKQPFQWYSDVSRDDGSVLAFDEQLKHSNENKVKVSLPSCDAQRRLNSVIVPINQELYQLLNQIPRLLAKETPFPTFILLKYVEPTQRLNGDMEPHKPYQRPDDHWFFPSFRLA
jgi:hypothetical protein